MTVYKRYNNCTWRWLPHIYKASSGKLVFRWGAYMAIFIINERGEMSFIQRMQISPLTSWVWQYWQHEDTGRIVTLVFWKHPGDRYFRLKLRG